MTPPVASSRRRTSTRCVRETLFVNTARAEVIEPGALLARLQRGDIPAALDVFDHEPLAADDPLCKIPGIVLTPHIAWRTDGAYIGMTKQVVQSIAAFFKGGGIQRRRLEKNNQEAAYARGR